MRMVYFWLSKVVGIENVDFNMGAAHRFSFDQTAHKLTAKRNESYISNFFQVPATKEKPYVSFNAIIGENGTGKTSIIEAVRDMLHGNYRGKYLYVLFENEEYSIYSNISKFICEGIENVKIKKQNKGINRIYYSNVFDSRTMLHSYTKNSSVFQDVTTNTLVKIRGNRFRWYISEELSDQISFCVAFANSPITEVIKIPADIEVSLFNDARIIENFPTKLPPYILKICSVTNKIFKEFLTSDLYLKRVKTEMYKDYYHFFFRQIIFYYFFEIDKIVKERSLYTRYYNILQKFIDLLETTEECSLSTLSQLLIEGLSQPNGKDHFSTIREKLIVNTGRIIQEIDLLIELLKEDKISPLHGTSAKTKLAGLPSEAIEMFNKWKEYSLGALIWTELSSGEYSMLSMFSRIYAAKRRLVERRMDSLTLILIDEGELYFHPQWQKDWVYFLLRGLNAIFSDRKNEEIQVLLTTHSPFILSDLPNDRVLLISKDQNGNGVRIVNQLDENPLTWGANIHSLYTNSFFLKDGLIGSFAKTKINHLAHDLINREPEYVRDNSKEIRNTIDLIGEPILKNKLIELYQQKIALLKPETKVIYDEIKELEERIKKLEQIAKNGDDN